MNISNAAYLRGFYDSSRAMGVKEASSGFSFEIEGFEGNWLLCKQTPWPTFSPAGAIEIPGPLGTTMWQPLESGDIQQGQISMSETAAGQLDQQMVDLMTRNGATFKAKIYEGTPEKFLCAKRIEGACIELDNPDQDWKNRSQPLIFNGMLTFHYYGEVIPGREAPNATSANIMRAANQQ